MLTKAAYIWSNIQKKKKYIYIYDPKYSKTFYFSSYFEILLQFKITIFYLNIF